MNEILKIPFGSFIKWTLVTALILLVIFVVSVNVYSYLFVGKKSALTGYFNDLNTPMEIHELEWQDCALRYISTGVKSDSAILLFFIHGAPGNLDNFKEYLADVDLRGKYKLVSMDRPGYGGSCPGRAVPDIAIQADAAAHILETLTFKSCYIISHSYGGPVAGKLAAEYPKLIDGIVMCAPLNDPEAEPMRWYSLLADWKLSRMLMPAFVDVATDEKMQHAEALRKIEKDWSTITVPVMHIHGKKDGLAPFEANVRFSKEHINPDLLTIYSGEKMGHLNIWINAGFVKNKILEFIAKTED